MLPPGLPSTQSRVQTSKLALGCVGLILGVANGCAGAAKSQPLPAPVTSARATPAETGPDANEMVDVTGGTFMMGGMFSPAHKESVASFQIGRTEVTTAAYRSCVAAGACTPPVGLVLDNYQWAPKCVKRIVSECNYDHQDREDHPINCINFAQATAYCAWRGERLPTDTEWEFAARGMAGRQYPWGDRPWQPDLANLCDAQCVNELRCSFPGISITVSDGYLFTAPVGSHPHGATPLGIEDMLGNVEEMTSTIGFSDDGQRDPNPGHLGRGRSWAADELLLFHNQFTDAFAAPDLGVRCAKNDTSARH